MKRKVKKRIVRGVCLTLAAAAAAGLFLQTTMSVQAATAKQLLKIIQKISLSGFWNWWITVQMLRLDIIFQGRNRI